MPAAVRGRRPVGFVAAAAALAPATLPGSATSHIGAIERPGKRPGKSRLTTGGSGSPPVTPRQRAGA
ncbi:MAG TPA: hypothetical protein VGW38_05965, partial [Chloroflexota bacterium]|nr:hypothetical protein [Chloroflexota bacterium]